MAGKSSSLTKRNHQHQHKNIIYTHITNMYLCMYIYIYALYISVYNNKYTYITCIYITYIYITYRHIYIYNVYTYIFIYGVDCILYVYMYILEYKRMFEESTPFLRSLKPSSLGFESLHPKDAMM
jgi:hypothetical protein